MNRRPGNTTFRMRCGFVWGTRIHDLPSTEYIDPIFGPDDNEPVSKPYFRRKFLRRLGGLVSVKGNWTGEGILSRVQYRAKHRMMTLRAKARGI